MLVIGKIDKVCTRNQDMHIYSCIYTCAWTFYIRIHTDSKTNVTINKRSQSAFKCFKLCMKNSTEEKRMA